MPDGDRRDAAPIGRSAAAMVIAPGAGTIERSTADHGRRSRSSRRWRRSTLSPTPVSPLRGWRSSGTGSPSVTAAHPTWRGARTAATRCPRRVDLVRGFESLPLRGRRGL